jgi:hypothetical protein
MRKNPTTNCDSKKSWITSTFVKKIENEAVDISAIPRQPCNRDESTLFQAKDKGSRNVFELMRRPREIHVARIIRISRDETDTF